MKRTFIALSAIATLAFAGFAFAHPGGYGPGAGRGYGPGMMGGGYGPGAGYCWGAQQQGEFKQVDEKGARALVEDYMKEHLKGYKIDSVQTYNMPRGTMYDIAVKDKSDNTFGFRVNPWGALIGPFPYSAPAK